MQAQLTLIASLVLAIYYPRPFNGPLQTFGTLVVRDPFHHFVVGRGAAFVSVVLDRVVKSRGAVRVVVVVPLGGAGG